jgi:lipopolysaccharide biosynthesis protein
MKTIAFYLPQYHPIPENDKWWGKGFTDWTNVTRAKPLFSDHFQPRLPADLGFYDLRLDKVRNEQANLAKKYGLHGFCYYYYWFNGKTLLDLPLKKVLESKEPVFPFCLCYANENWTKRWDGHESEILIKQEHSPENDRHFIRDIIPIFQDERYIKLNEKPLLLVYKTTQLPDPLQTCKIWREEAKKAGFKDLYLCNCHTFGDLGKPAKSGFDAAVEFPPHCLGVSYSYEYQDMVTSVLPSFRGYVFDYPDTAVAMMNREWPEFKLFKTVMLAWDNTARRGLSASIFHNFSVDFYERWLAKVIKRTIQRYPEEERLVFINAWNEWAEGTYLEPDQKYGLGYLEATERAILAGQSWETIVSSLEKFGKDSHVDHKVLLEGILNYLENKENIELSLTGVRDLKIKALKTQMSVFRPRRFFLTYRKFRDKLFPHGTRRREIAKSFKFKFLSR